MKKATRKNLDAIKPLMESMVWWEIQSALKSGGIVWIPEDFGQAVERARREPNQIILLLEYPVTFTRRRYVMLHPTGKLVLGAQHDDRHDD